MLTVREEDRRSGRLYREIIGALNPALLAIPINPVPAHKRAAKAARKRLRRLAGVVARKLGIYDRLRPRG